jgi:hypothetical protein
MLRHDGAKRATSDYDCIEGARPSTNQLPSTVERFLQGVAEKAPHIIQRESSGFRWQYLRHGIEPLC